LCYKEVIAHDTQVGFLQSLGFEVRPHAYGIQTSYEAEFGSGGRLVVFNAEYDALPFADGPLHACGHNLIAISALVGFLGTATILKARGAPGRVRILGTPAEEGGAGKAKLLDAGAYEGVDACLMGHPAPKQIQGDGYSGTAGHRTIARAALTADFYGKPAHAGGNPWDGLNALDALVATYNSVSMLRQQTRPEERIHTAFLKVPQVMNVIPDHTRVSFGTRSPAWAGATKLLERVIDCLKAGALATGCKIEYSRLV
jgi:amidohydrolase